MLMALVMFILNRIPIYEVDFSWMEMVGTAVLGWVFLMAKDTLLEGIFLNIFKINKNGETITLSPLRKAGRNFNTTN